LIIGQVFDSLELTPHLDTVVLSEEEGVEKPSKEIFERTLSRLNISQSLKLEDTLHVGDELAA